MKVARTIVAKYSPEKYLLSHCSIIAAVDVDQANPNDPKSDWYIHPAYSKFVNNNGDAWTKKMIVASYKSFVGANNYLEHVQIPELSKGKIIDAVLREVPIGKDKYGKDLTTYYVDILVATERKHKELVRKIEAGEMNSMSMGCKISFSICTKCGNKAVDEAQACQHVRFEKNSTFIDEMGVTRKVAELCGRYDEPDSVQFIDASWVANPAFTGAVRRSTVAPPAEVMAKLEKANTVKTYEAKDDDYLKVAQDAPPAEPPPEEPPAEEPPADKPPEDVPADAPPTEPPAEEPPAEAPPEMPPPPDAPSGEDTVKEWKNKIKKMIMDNLGQEIAKEFSGEMDEALIGPRPLETLDETMIHPAATAAVKNAWKLRKSWNSYLLKKAGHLNQQAFDRLRYGTYMLLTTDNLSCLKEYGYNRKDFLAVLSFLDNCFKKPLAKDVVKAMVKVGSINARKDSEIVKELMWHVGRPMTAGEAKKALSWLKEMNRYPADRT